MPHKSKNLNSLQSLQAAYMKAEMEAMPNMRDPFDILSFNSFRDLEEAYLDAEVRAASLKALYDEACDTKRRKPATPTPGQRAASQTALKASEAIKSNPSLLTRLISFCHPDRHGGSLKQAKPCLL